jgi:hypothetical protein
VNQIPPGGERRKEVREPASGWVELLFEDPEPVLVSGEILERSLHGFRAAHNHSRLRPGLEVSFRSEHRAGRARAMWTQVQGARCVSGFFVL